MAMDMDFVHGVTAHAMQQVTEASAQFSETLSSPSIRISMHSGALQGVQRFQRITKYVNAVRSIFSPPNPDSVIAKTVPERCKEKRLGNAFGSFVKRTDL